MTTLPTTPGPAYGTGTGPLPIVPSIPSEVAASTPHRGTASLVPELRPGILHAIQSLLYIIVVASFILAFTVQPFRIPSESMEPTLLVGDFLLVSKRSLGFDNPGGVLPPASVHRGQIVVFHYPLEPGTHLIKRIVGIPGDHLRLRNDHVFIDNKPLDEPYAVYRPGPPDLFRDNFPRLQSADPSIDSNWWIAMHRLIQDGELIVPDGQYFVLGDNRNDSEDSRYWGFVPREDIVGTPLLIYFSLNQTADGDEPAALPDPHKGDSPSFLSSLLHFARWNRSLRPLR